MQSYYVDGRRDAALRQYAECVEALRRELDAEPSSQTVALFEAIRSDSPAPVQQGEGSEAPATEIQSPGERPSIAVLPFRNTGGDPDQDYFAEGISEDIISGLSRFRWFFVISRHSTFGFRDSSLDVANIASNLGVRYVLEGSVRRSGNKIRITASLLDASKSRHVWSERYDFEEEDLFVVQDQITQAVISQAFPKFLQSEADRAMRVDITSLGSWDLTMRARWHLWRFNKADIDTSKALIEQVLENDPNNAMALADLAGIHLISGLYGWSPSAPASLALAYQTAQLAASFDDQDAWTFAILGLVEAAMREHDAGLRHLRRAIQLNPNFSFAHGFLGLALAFSGQVDEARQAIDETIRLSPFDQFMAVWFIARSAAAFVNEDYEEAITWAQRSVEERPDFPSGQRLLAASYGMSNRIDEAQRAVMDVLRLIPDQTIGNLRVQLPYGDPEVVERFLEGLRRGGLGEE
jgi:TolB-like protein/Tfp pilus assembly protein PilF